MITSQLQHIRKFMKAIKESPRNTFPWWACYFTNSKESWYPPAEKKLNF